MKKIDVIIYAVDPELNKEAFNYTMSSLSGSYNITVINEDRSKGFAASCNEIIRELDNDHDLLIMTDEYFVCKENVEEMSRVLDLSEHNGAVIPRTNGGYFSRYPYTGCDKSEPEEPAEARRCFNNTHEFLEDFTVIPYPDTRIIMIKRVLLDNWGMFFDKFKSPSAAIRIVCEEMNKPGFSTVMANHTFVTGLTAGTDTYEEKELEILSGYYGYLVGIVDDYRENVDFYNGFCRVLDPEYYKKKRVLIVNLSDKEFLKMDMSDWDITYVDQNNYENEITGQYHAGIIYMDHFEPEIYIKVSRACMKMAVYFDPDLLSYFNINTREQAVQYKCLKMIYNTAELVIIKDEHMQKEFGHLFGTDKGACNEKIITDIQCTDSLLKIVQSLINASYDKKRVQLINNVERYIWKLMQENEQQKKRMTELFTDLIMSKKIQ